MSPRAIVYYCGLLMTVGAFSTDSTLPTFPFLVEDLSTSWDNAQLTITIFVFTAGLGQLVAGTASDRFGRRAVIQAGLAVYFAGSVLATLAPDIVALLVGRALQGLGGGASVAISRAILRDLFTGRDLARNMAFSSAVFAFGPIVAPLVGAGLLLVFSWRSIFVLMIGFVAFLLAVALRRLPETLTSPDPQSLRPSGWLANVRALFGHRQSRFFLLLSGVSHTMMMLIIVGLARVYEDSFGITGPLFAVYFATHGIGIIVGQMANRRVIAAAGVLTTTRIAAGILFGTALIMALASYAGFAGAILVSALFVVFATSYLIVYSNAAAMTLDPHGAIAGFTSSFFGFFSQVVAGLMVVGLARFVAGDLRTFSATLTVIAAMVLIALLAYRPRSA